ncbi:hypothetical protein NL676_033073 [Syzygium grande]|nr:hypothetical protein NL676_033073 [Syzygium grande]
MVRSQQGLAESTVTSRSQWWIKTGYVFTVALAGVVEEGGGCRIGKENDDDDDDSKEYGHQMGDNFSNYSSWAYVCSSGLCRSDQPIESKIP